MITVEIAMPITEIEGIAKSKEEKIRGKLVKSAKQILKRIDMAQVKIYTQTLRPSKPPDSKSRRTFTLQGASKIEITSTTLPTIEGVWQVDESKATYARYVVGKRWQQTFINRGRWKSLNEVQEEVDYAAVRIINENLEGL